MKNLFSHNAQISFSERPSFEGCGMWSIRCLKRYSGDMEV